MPVQAQPTASRRLRMRIPVTVWLWALVLMPTVPLLGFFAYSVNQYAAERTRSMESRLVDQADELASTAQGRLEQTLGSLTALSLSNAAVENDVPRLYQAAKRLQEASVAMSAISLVDRNEKLVFVTLRPLGTELPAAELQSVRETFRTGKPSLSKPFLSPVSDRTVVALNVPVIRDGKIDYCLRGILRVDTLSDFMRPPILGPDWIAGIFDRDGVTIARSLSPEVYVGKLASPRLVEAIKNGDGSVWRGFTREGIETLTVVRRVGQWQWAIALSVPVATIVAPVRLELWRFGVLVLAVLALLAVTVAVLNRYITGRLLEVVDDARSAIAGDLPPLASTGIRELDDLRHSLTRADLYRATMARQVEERTAELGRAQLQLTEFAAQLDANIERERVRLAREVHDQIGAIFTGVSMLIGGIPATAMPADLRASINQALDLGLATARRITAELRPPLLDHLGLAAAVEDMAAKMLNPAGISVGVQLLDAERLPARQAIGCYRIIQEACTNALRHSGCSHLLITGEASGTSYSVTIQDDGRGLKADTDSIGHFGMMGMRERARLMGGELEVVSQAGAGVTVRVSVPLNAEIDERAIPGP